MEQRYLHWRRTSISTVKNKRKLSTPCLEAVVLPRWRTSRRWTWRRASIITNKGRDFFLTFFVAFYDRIEIQSAYRKEHDEKQTLLFLSHSCCLFFFYQPVCRTLRSTLKSTHCYQLKRKPLKSSSSRS